MPLARLSFACPSGRAPAWGRACAARGRRRGAGFTLIELILVMALLTVAVSFTVPALSRFFGGRTLDSEARRLLALTRHGQSRAASEGLPMDLWFDSDRGQFGLELEPSFDTTDPKKEQFELDNMLKLEVSTRMTLATTNIAGGTQIRPTASILKTASAHPGLPRIRFMPDGSIGDNSPENIRLYDRQGVSVWMGQTKDGQSYEIRDKER